MHLCLLSDSAQVDCKAPSQLLQQLPNDCCHLGDGAQRGWGDASHKGQGDGSQRGLGDGAQGDGSQRGLVDGIRGLLSKGAHRGLDSVVHWGIGLRMVVTHRQGQLSYPQGETSAEEASLVTSAVAAVILDACVLLLAALLVVTVAGLTCSVGCIALAVEERSGGRQQL